MDPDAILEELNEEQRQAAMATSGPVAILAGAGTGKTRVISHRVAYAVATGLVDPKRILVVTFTDKAATEMKHRLRRLGLPGVAASTFHSAAKRQLEFYWPRLHGRPLPNVLDSKLGIIIPLARALPGGYKFTSAKDLADEIEWAKARRIGPGEYQAEAAQANREPPVPADVFASVYRRYEQARQRRGVIDFEDMLGLAVDLYETDAEAADLVRQRYAWFSVDEYQDTNRLQEDLLRLWLGDRRDLCVVGDPNQTIYSFTGATADYLTGFSDRYPGCRVIDLTQNYRSIPQILSLANRLTASRLRATLGDGASPTLTAFPDAAAEESAILAAIRAQAGAGVPLTEIAILVRTNAQLVPFESLMTRAGIPFSVRGQRFFARAEVRAARQALTSGRLSGGLSGELEQVLVARWRTVLGFDEAQPAGPGAEARDRHASLLTLLDIARELLARSTTATVDNYLAELDRRDADEAVAAGSGVVLSTYHRAKGLEWDVVFLPMLEEGTLPIRQSLKDDEAIAEERRLLYVGITRARRELAISWVAQRPSPKGGVARARPSRFVAELRPGSLPRSSVAPPRSLSEESLSGASADLFEALRAWRLERARADGVPAYVVADNKTLSAVAVQRPDSPADLLTVPGMGPHRVATYGDEMLAVIGSAR